SCSSSEPSDKTMKPVWTSTSTHLALHSFGTFEGMSGYDKDRNDITPTQLDALARLKLIPTPTHAVTDLATYKIAITDANGSATDYRAAKDNVLSADEKGAPASTVD